MTRYLTTMLFVMATACYGMPPPLVPVALPMQSEEATLKVQTVSRRAIEDHPTQQRTCPANVTDQNSPQCLVTTRQVPVPVTHVEITATYGSEAISYAQFRLLTDVHYKDKVARLNELRGHCRYSVFPEQAGGVLFLGGLITGLVGATDSTFDYVDYIGWGSVAVGLVSAYLGHYALGGQGCKVAWELYHDLDLQPQTTWMKVEGEERAREMAALARQFNERRGVQEPAHDGDAAAPAPDAATAPAVPAADQPPP